LILIKIQKMEKKFRIPRKLKKKIPKGMYCYEGTSYQNEVYHVKNCEFYKNIKVKDKPENQQDEIDKGYPNESVGWCKLLKCEIDDQCKNCGIN